KADRIGRGDSVPELGTVADLETAVAGLKQNQVSQPFQAGQNKIAVAVVNQIFPAHQAELAEVEEQIRERLITEKTARLSEEKTKEAMDKMKAAAASGADL